MFKILLIGFKDLTVLFRDRAALILMLLAPFVLTLGLGVVTGRFFGGTSSGLSDIPVIVVNQDDGQLGETLVELFNADELAELMAPVAMDDVAAARAQVESDAMAAVVIIPAGFTDSVIPRDAAGVTAAPKSIEIYANPARPLSASVVQTVVEMFLSEVEVGAVSGQVIVRQLIASGRLAPQEAAEAGEAIGQRLAEGETLAAIQVQRTIAGQNPDAEFDILSYLAPGMALLFLMYTVSLGARSLLMERDGGTLPRLLITPTTTAQVLAGKLLGTYFSGVAQLAILIGGSTLLFGLRWGDPLGLIALVLAVAAGATGWGVLLASVCRTPGQVASIGSALMLTFGILGGSLVQIPFPAWMQPLTQITPNAWGIQGFTELGAGGTLAGIVPNLIALVIMALVLFAISAVLFRRGRGLQK